GVADERGATAQGAAGATGAGGDDPGHGDGERGPAERDREAATGFGLGVPRAADVAARGGPPGGLRGAEGGRCGRARRAPRRSQGAKCGVGRLVLDMSTTDAATILVVEDDEPTRTFLADNLTADGYELLVAENAQHGLRLLETKFPDLVLVD